MLPDVDGDGRTQPLQATRRRWKAGRKAYRRITPESLPEGAAPAALKPIERNGVLCRPTRVVPRIRPPRGFPGADLLYLRNGGAYVP